MNSTKRVFINTMAQYIRTVISVVVSLYTSRVVLYNLGVEDYGIYNLVAGVIALLSFFSDSLSTTTQRYLSYNQGKNDNEKLKLIFNNSLLTQTAISLLISLVLLALTPLLFNGILNIPPERISAARFVYYYMILSLFFNFESAPYRAALIAHENIAYASLIQIIDALLKIPVAISLIYISQDKLVWYSLLSLGIVIFNFFGYYLFCTIKYKECKELKLRLFNAPLFKEMFSFMWWMIYSSGCVAARTQGVAILLNRAFSTAINAAYGIGQQVSGQIAFLSNSLTTAMRPLIIRAEGSGNRDKMFRLSEMSCKIAFILLGCISIPAIIHMEDILSLWLVEVPEYAVMFCSFFVFGCWVDELTLSLMFANQAVGNVKVYSLWVNTIKIITLPIAYWILKMGGNPTGVMIAYVVVETVCMLSRLVFLHININLSIHSFVRNVIYPVLLPTILTIGVCLSLSRVLSGWYCLLNFIVSSVFLLVTTLLIGLNKEEKQIVRSLVKRS